LAFKLSAGITTSHRKAQSIIKHRNSLMEFALLPESTALVDFILDIRISLRAPGSYQAANIQKTKNKKQGFSAPALTVEHYLGRPIEAQRNIISSIRKVNDFDFSPKSA
jgi:hypothetical protein